MDISELTGGGEITPTVGEPASSNVAAAAPNPLEESIAALRAEVTSTKSTLDDMIVKQREAAMLNEYNNFKGTIADFDEGAFFGALEEKYNEFIKEGATPEHAQSLVDRVFQNPIGWKALWSEVQMKREPAAPDPIIPSAAASNMEELPVNRAGLGKFLNKEGSK